MSNTQKDSRYSTSVHIESDTELWPLVLAGRSDAWRKLIQRYQALVYAIATRAGLSYADASDCFQHTWVLLHKHRGSIKDPARLSAWLTTTAKREALRLKRRSGRDVSIDSVADPPDSAILPDQEILRTERQAHIEIAVAELDERCRKLMKLVFFGDEKLSYEQIAAEMGFSTNALGPARRRCLDRLKRILQKGGYLDARNDDLDYL
ncbi:sigma-70 family RNA polymerase sigma factor [bacterium]|nr:sigma-70 family RNA polymerase sigma factor [bacterium]